MKKILFITTTAVCSLLLISCGGSKTTISYSKNTYSKANHAYFGKIKNENIYDSGEISNIFANKSEVVVEILREAESYRGTPYRYGGETRSGIDCSGLIVNSFKVADIDLPRRSVEQSEEGENISLKHVKEGDLLFFSTGGGKINHVGIVHNVSGSGEISFIHASTSKGVVISTLEEKYWERAFQKAKRIL